MADAAPTPPEGRKTVLIVEDEKVTAEIITAYLSKAGYAAFAVNSAESAMKAIGSGNLPDLFLLDIGLPGQSGLDLCRTIKEAPETMKIPVIILTAETDAKLEETGLKAGAVDFIRKPVLNSVLEARVGLQLNRDRIIPPGQDDKKADAFDGVISQIKKFASSNVEGDVGDKNSKLHIINLEPIKRAFASRWDLIEKKVIFISDSMISSSIVKGEAYKYFGMNLFAIVLPTLSNAEGKVKTRAIAEKLCRKLLGDEYDSGRYGTDFTGQLLTFDLSAKDKNNTTQDTAHNFEHMKKKILSEISLEYRPIWNPETRNVDGYRASFCRTYSGVELFGRHILHGGPSDRLWPPVYEVMFEDILSRIDLGNKSHPYYVITLHIEFMLSKNFTSMIQKFLSKPELRKKLKIEIVGIDDDIQISTFKAAVMLLRNLCDGVMVRTSPDSLITHELKYFGITSIGFNLYDLIRSGLGQRGAYVVAAHFAKKANLLGFNGYVWGVNTIQDYQIISATKFGMLCGRAFGVNDNKLHTIYPLPPSFILTGSAQERQS